MSNFPFPFGIPQPSYINNQNQQNPQYNRFPMPQYQQQGLQFNPMMVNNHMVQQPHFMNGTPQFNLLHIQPNMIPNPNFLMGQRIIPQTDLPYEFSNLSKHDINKILILENIDKKISDANVYESFNEIAPVEKVRLFRLAKKPFAFVFMQQNDGAKKLIEDNQEIKQNPNISLFNHKLARVLIYDKQIDVYNLQKQYSKPEEFAKLILGNNLEKECHKIGAQMPLSFEAHSIRVREIWIGYFSMQVNVEMIQKVLQQYGQLDHVDLKRKTQNFAFVKFKSADDAKNCIENQESISLQFGGKLKVSYSDFLKRNQIVGDDVFQRNNDHKLTSILFVSFQMGLKLPSKKRILKKFSKIGKIKNLLIRPSADINEVLKSYFLVEYSSIETAKKARKHFYIEDKTGERREKLGDPRAEVNIILKPNVVGNIFELISPHMKMPLKNLPPIHQQQIQQIDNMNIGQARPPPPPSMMNNQNQSNQLQFGEYPFVWTGFITRNRKNQVGVDCFEVLGSLNNIMDDSMYNLNISHRIKPEEIINMTPNIILIFRPSNETYNDKFELHMNYLKERNTFGVVNCFYPNNLYLIPYGQYTMSYVPNAKQGDVVGVFITMENEDENDDMDDSFDNQFYIIQQLIK